MADNRTKKSGKNENRLTAQDIHKLTLETLQAHFGLEREDAWHDEEAIWDVVIAASVERETVETMSDLLEGSPSANTVRDALATLSIAVITVCAASSASGFPTNAELTSSGLLKNVRVTSGYGRQVERIGFGQVGPIGVLSASTQMSGGKSRFELYAGSKGFVVNRIGAVYDLEGGAVLKVRDGFSLTGSYRMLGYDFLATGSENTEPQLSGTFFGLKVDF